MISGALSLLKTDEERNRLSEFYEKNKKRFFAIAFSRLHNREAAEDAVQEAFLRLTDKPEKFFTLPANKQVAFADVIIRNISVDMFKESNKIETVEMTDTVSSEGIELPLDEKIVGYISRDGLIDFISGLSSSLRDVLELKVVIGLSNREIAQMLSVTENVVRQRLFQARRAITEFMESENT